MAAVRHSEPKKLAALLRGELDWVVMKCLEKQRDRRYETANGLARDIQRYLSNELVEARPPSAGYRVRKFVSRHRGQVLAAGLVLLALVAGVAGITWGLIREAKANAELRAASAVIERTNADLAASNDRVEARYKIAMDAIKTFHTGVSEDFLLKEPQFKALRDRLLKSAAGFYERLATLLGKETDAASRRALAAARSEIADLTADVGDLTAALALSREVLAAREALAAEPGADPETNADVARTLFEISKQLHDFGKPDDSFATLRRAEPLLVDVARSSPSSAAVQDALASCRVHLVRALAERGKLDEALVACRQARTHYEARNSEAWATAKVRNNLAVAVGNIGNLLSNTGKSQEAEAEHRAAIAINQKLIDEYPTNGNYRNSQARQHNNLAVSLAHTGRLKEAEAEYRAALALWRALAEEYPAVNYVQNNVAFVRVNLGGILQTLGRTKEAEAEYRAAQAVLRKVADEHPSNLLYRGNFAYGSLKLAVVLLSLGRPAEAQDEADRAVSLLRAMVEANPRLVGRLGESLLRAGQARRALGRSRWCGGAPEARDRDLPGHAAATARVRILPGGLLP
jgi:eukaryotic-like serine/threonine-protein kinase